MGTDAHQKLPELGELERAILEYLWRAGESDVIQAHGALGVPRGIKVNTVGSALARLFRKALVKREKVGHAYQYRPTLDVETFRVKMLVDAAGGTKELASERGLVVLVETLVGTRPEALDDLEELIRQRRRRPAR